jgi:hypothetical protein
MRWAIIGLLLLAGCSNTAATNSNGTPVTTVEQSVGIAYASYDTAVAVWITALTGGKVSKVDIANGEAARENAYSALNSLRLAAVAGASNTAALQDAFTQALGAFQGFMAARGLPAS